VQPVFYSGPRLVMSNYRAWLFDDYAGEQAEF